MERLSLRRAAGEVGRAAPVAAVVGGFVAGVEATEWNAPWWIGAAVLLVVAGAVAARAWVTAVPPVVLVADGLLSVGGERSGDIGPGEAASLLFGIGLGMGFLVLIGVGVGHVWRSRGEPARGRRVSGAPSPPRTTPWGSR